jgi:hypothetical protein
VVYPRARAAVGARQCRANRWVRLISASVPKPADLLELFTEEARVYLDMQIQASDGLDRSAGLLLAFAAAVAAFSEVTSRWLPAGRLCAAAAALAAVVVLMIRPVAPDVPHINDRAERQRADVETAMRELKERRLDDAARVRSRNRVKSGLLYAGAILLTVAIALIGLGTL